LREDECSPDRRSDAHSGVVRAGIWWILGLAASVYATWIAILEPFIGLPIAVAVLCALLLRTRSWAMGGAMLLATGLWFSYFHLASIQRCAQLNSATGSCTVVDASGTAYPAMAFVVCGVILSLYGLGKRSARGGE
jgi:hypothetical protein